MLRPNARLFLAVALLAALIFCHRGRVQAHTTDEVATAVGSLLVLPSSIYTPEVAVIPPPEGGIDILHQQLREAVRQGKVSEAFRLAAMVLQSSPDDATARRILGYERVGDHWGGRLAALRLKQGFIWDQQFGWVKPDHLGKMRGGFRPRASGWVSAAEDAASRDSIQNGWTMRTDHVQVTTDHSLEAAAAMAVRIETLYQLWRQLFGEFTATPKEVQGRLDGKAGEGFRRKPFQVFFHRSRDAYNAALRRRQPQIDMTIGIYFDQERESHFFAGEDQDPGTLNHEAVHQFFQETIGSRRHVTATANAWAVEGVACYFESLVRRRVDGRAGAESSLHWYTIGTPEAGRLPAARQRLLEDEYYVPLARLSTLSKIDLQQRSDIAPLYSQSAGLAGFFMDDQAGARRGAFRRFLRTVYAGRDDVGTIVEETGESFAELDAQYRRFLEQLPEPEIVGAASRDGRR